MPQNALPIDAIQINRRFFEAVDDLQNRRLIRGLGTLAKKWSVSRFILSTTRGFPDKKRLDVELIHYLSRDYGVSVTWIISGTGPMYSDNKIKK